MPLVTHPEGNGMPVLSPEATWMSLKTKRPHTESGAAPTGVLNEKYWVTLVYVLALFPLPYVAVGA